MNSPATALVADSRFTVRPPSVKSRASMLPERSTASMRLRPVTGASSALPVTWGRAAATTSSVQASAASSNRGRSAKPRSPPSARGNSAVEGTRSAALSALGAGGISHRASSGSGSSRNTQGQAKLASARRPAMSPRPLTREPPDS